MVKPVGDAFVEYFVTKRAQEIRNILEQDPSLQEICDEFYKCWEELRELLNGTKACELLFELEDKYWASINRATDYMYQIAFSDGFSIRERCFDCIN